MCPGADILVLTCEHAGNRVPRPWRPLFRGAEAVLASHRGWDPGAAPLAIALARRLGVPLLAYPYTRLLIEPNRSLGHPALFSAFSRELPRPERDRLVDTLYRPHRDGVEAAVRAAQATGKRAVHVAVHTFTPVLDGSERNAEMGLLYDPARAAETAFCRVWQNALRAAAADLRVRRNYPYRGAADGLTTHLRSLFPESGYLGIELEVNQALAVQPDASRTLARVLATTLPLQNQ